MVARRHLLAGAALMALSALASCSNQTPTQNAEPPVLRPTDPYALAVARRLVLIYPKPMRESHKEGSLLLRMVIGRNGNLIDVTIDRSSEPAFDSAALDAARLGAPFPPVPDTLKGDKVIVVVPIHFVPSKT